MRNPRLKTKAEDLLTQLRRLKYQARLERDCIQDIAPSGTGVEKNFFAIEAQKDRGNDEDRSLRMRCTSKASRGLPVLQT